MVSLQRTIAFKQVAHITLLVRKDLHLDMARGADIAFQQNLAIAEGSLSLGPSGNQFGGKIGQIMHLSHTAPAAPGAGFDQ